MYMYRLQINWEIKKKNLKLMYHVRSSFRTLHHGEKLNNKGPFDPVHRAVTLVQFICDKQTPRLMRYTNCETKAFGRNTLTQRRAVSECDACYPFCYKVLSVPVIDITNASLCLLQTFHASRALYVFSDSVWPWYFCIHHSNFFCIINEKIN
jgi:hypothetical protein